MISFLASQYGCGTRIRTLGMTESESVALPLGDAAFLTNGVIIADFRALVKGFCKKNAGAVKVGAIVQLFIRSS